MEKRIINYLNGKMINKIPTLIYIKKPSSHKQNLLEDCLKLSGLGNDKNSLFLQNLNFEVTSMKSFQNLE